MSEIKEGFYTNGEKIILYYRGMKIIQKRKSTTLELVDLCELLVNYYPEPRVDKFVMPKHYMDAIKSGEYEHFENYV